MKRTSRAIIAVACIEAVAGALGAVALAFVVSIVVGHPIPPIFVIVAVAGVLLRCALGFAGWWTTRYQLSDEALIYRTGTVSSTSLHIPWSSVRGIYVEIPLLLRLFRRAEVTVTHAAGQDTDVRFRALSMASVAELRRNIGDSAQPGADVQDDEAGFRRGKIGLYAIARGRWYIAIGLAAAAIGLYARFLDQDFGETTAQLWAALTSLPAAYQWLLAALAVVVAIAIGVVVVLLQMAGFRVRDSGDEVETRNGRGVRRTRTVKKSDVTRMDVRQPPLFRLTRCAYIVASGGSGDGDSEALLSTQTPRDDVLDVVHRVFPEHQIGPLVAQSSVRVIATRGALWLAALAVAQWLVAAVWSLWVVAGIALIVCVVVVRSPATLRWADSGAIELCKGILGRRRIIFRASSILHFEAAQGLFASRRRAHRLTLTIADGGPCTLTVPAISQRELEHVSGLLRDCADVGTYRFRRSAHDATVAAGAAGGASDAAGGAAVAGKTRA